MRSQWHLAVQKGLTLVLLTGCRSLCFLSTRRQTEGKSSSKFVRRLRHLSTVYRDSEGLFAVKLWISALELSSIQNMHSSPFSAKITWLQVGESAKYFATWPFCSNFPIRTDKQTDRFFPFCSSKLRNLAASNAEKMGTAGAICNHIISSPWQVALWDFCFKHFAVQSLWAPACLEAFLAWQWGCVVCSDMNGD